MGAPLQRAWLHRGVPALLLWPLSLVFGAVAAVRRQLYRLGLQRTERVAVPVVIIGNVVAGGAGKTPVTAAIVEHLDARGIPAGIVSRGYGRRARDCREVRAGSDPHLVGDEPLLLARETGVPVFVAPRRADAARALLRLYPGTRVIVSDDGLQHLALARDIEVCVFDDRGVGNGWLLPAGPLREPWPRAVDLVVTAEGTRGIEGFTVARRLADHAIARDGTQVPLAQLHGVPFAAVAGIARPQVFFDMLRATGLSVGRTLAFPDHAPFDAPVDTGGLRIVCTAKDAAKLWRHHPDALAGPLVATLPDAFWHAFDRLLDARLSSTDGPQTA
jgi:tetraacyldisaccharide 4'-kinase